LTGFTDSSHLLILSQESGQIINIDGGNSLRSGPDYGEVVVMMHGESAIPGAGHSQ
jgi:hypothetical protein